MLYTYIYCLKNLVSKANYIGLIRPKNIHAKKNNFIIFLNNLELNTRIK